jgi:hypothetical protein
MVHFSYEAHQPLQYFVHDDTDALRMEIAGSLAGSAARRAYEDWRTAVSSTRPRPLVIDISYVTETDVHGQAVLAAWCRLGIRIIGCATQKW